MAEKRQTVTFDSIMRDLKARKYKPVYLLMGEETYYIDKISDYISASVLAPEERDFNQTIVFGADVTAAQVADMAKGYPMMAPYRVVIVKEAQGLKTMDAIEKYCEHPVETTVLVICYKNGLIDKRKKMVARAQAAGVVFESNKKKDYELAGFMKDYLAGKEMAIDGKAAAMIADHIGADLSRIASELDKILIALNDGEKQITPEVVERLIGISKDFNNYELTNAVIDRDVFKANLIVKYFDKNPKSGSVYVLLPTLFNFFQNLLIAYYAPDRKSEYSVAQFLGLKNPYQARSYVTAMRNYSGKKVLEIISKLRETDAKSKGINSVNIPPGELLKELIAFIFY